MFVCLHGHERKEVRTTDQISDKHQPTLPAVSHKPKPFDRKVAI